MLLEGYFYLEGFSFWAGISSHEMIASILSFPNERAPCCLPTWEAGS